MLKKTYVICKAGDIDDDIIITRVIGFENDVRNYLANLAKKAIISKIAFDYGIDANQLVNELTEDPRKFMMNYGMAGTTKPEDITKHEDNSLWARVVLDSGVSEINDYYTEWSAYPEENIEITELNSDGAEDKVPSTPRERLTALLYNAITFMAENQMKDDEIAEYLGSTEDELNALDVLGREW